MSADASPEYEKNGPALIDTISPQELMASKKSLINEIEKCEVLKFNDGKKLLYRRNSGGIHQLLMS